VCHSSLVTLATNPFIVSILYLFCVPEGKSCVKRSSVLPRVKRNRLVFVPDFTRDYFLSNLSRRNVELRSVLIKPLTPRTSYGETSVNRTFKSVDKILWCYQSNETSSAVLSLSTIYVVCSSNFKICGQIPMVLPFN